MELFEDARTQANVPEFTVSEISGAVKRVIEGEFGRVRVRGEIGRISRPSSGHLYLDLKDENAVLGAVIWRSTARTLAFRPEDGMEVVATGRLTTFPGASKYQMVIESLAPAGVGALMAMLEKRKQALAAEGLFDVARKRPLPYLPEIIGVVTSPSGAVIRDILHRLRERFPRPVLIWPVTVQGERCAAEVAAAIRGFNAIAPGGPVPRPDLLIVARGGGSLEDLWGFSEEIVVRAVAEGTIPLISAVGHETDTTLIDFVADRRAPTPTAAAEMAVPVRLDLVAAAAGLEHRRRNALARTLAQKRQRLRDLARGLPRPDALVAERAQRLDGLSVRLPLALIAFTRHLHLALERGAAGRFGPELLRADLDKRRQRLLRAGHDLPHLFARSVARSRQRLLHARLHPATVMGVVKAHRAGLDACAARLDAIGRRRVRESRTALDALGRTLKTLDPHNVLERGYAIVRDGGGTVLTRAEPARTAARLEIEFADGRVGARPDRTGRKGPGSEPGQGQLF